MTKRSRLFDLAPVGSPLPGVEMLTTDAAREVAKRSQFAGGLDQHVYVNGYDLARVESAGLRDPRIVELLTAHGWYAPSENPMEIYWFRRGDVTFAKRTITDAVIAVVASLEDPVTTPVTVSERPDADRSA